VVLTVAVVLIDLRFSGRWADGVRFAVAGLAAAFVLALAWLAPVEDETPRAYVSVLLVAGFALALLALTNLAQLLGAASLKSSGAATWVGLVLAVSFASLARARNSAVSTLLSAATAVLTLLFAVDWIFSPTSQGTFRWVLAFAMAALSLGVMRLRDHQRRHAVALVNAVGLSAVLLGGLALVSDLVGPAFGAADAGFDLGTGWELVLLVVGCGLAAYSAADREPGPGYVGALVLVIFVLIASPPGSSGPSLVGWPLLLLVLGAAVIAAGLRPARPLPPAPDAGAPSATTAVMPRPANEPDIAE